MTQDALRLLKHLRGNSRERLLKISRRSKISVTTLLKLYSYLKDEYIVKNCSIIDFEKLSIKRFLFIIDFRSIDASISKSIAMNSNLIVFLKNSTNVNNLMLLERGLMADVLFHDFVQYKIFAKQLRRFDILGLEIHPIEEHIVAENFFSYSSGCDTA
jgi:DNA-binding Lrp family transcriptional regulator